MASAHDMVQRCFRHQHPEAYGRDEVSEAVVPPDLRYGTGNVSSQGTIIAEPPMGHPHAIPIPSTC